MNTIKFILPDRKLYCVYGWPTEFAKLLAVIPERRESFSRSFLRYDHSGNPDAEGIANLQSEGDCVLLLFQRKEDRQLFATVRSTKKLEFYRSQIGNDFKVEIQTAGPEETQGG